MVSDDPETSADLDGHVQETGGGTQYPGDGPGPSCASAGEGASGSVATGCGPSTNVTAEQAEDEEQAQDAKRQAQNLSVADVTKIIQQAKESSSDGATTALTIFNNLGNNVSVTGAVLREALSKSGVALEGAGADLISHADSISKSGSAVTILSSADYSTKQGANTLYIDKKVTFNVGMQAGLPAFTEIQGVRADTAKHSGVTINEIAVAMHAYTKKENVSGVPLGVPIRSLAVTGSKWGVPGTQYTPIQ